MNTKTDEGLYEKARKLFISKASIDEFAGWATPRQVDAVHRLLDTELANRERAKHDRLLRRARFPVVKGLDGYDFTNVRLPDGYMLDELLGLGFIPRAQDLVFYGKTGRGKTHLAIGLGMKAIDMGLGVRFHQTAELVLQLGKAKRDGTLETMLRDIGRADLIILDEFGYVPFDIDGARLLYRIRSIYFTDLEIEKLIDYVSNSVELLGEAEDTWERTAEDMENGLGSAIRKLYKGRRGEKIYAKYKTKRGKSKR